MAQSEPSECISIGADHLRRLLFSVINGHQDRLIRKGVIGEAARLSGQCPHATDSIDDRVVDEGDLGFDSLARLDLVAELTERFGYAETGVEDYLLHRRRIGDWLELTAWHLAQRGASAQFGFSSSGSTGPASWTTHKLVDLCSEIDAIRTGLLAETPPQRILSLVPPQHIYGFLWTVLLPAAAGLSLRDVPAGLASSAFRHAQAGDLIVATPFGWEALAKSGKSLPDGVIGVSSGGPTTDHTWAAARALGLSRFIEIYGATETGGIGWRDANDQPFALASDIERQGERLTRMSSPDDALTLQDRINWVAAREFTVLGRHDTVVQVAGVNVNLTELSVEICAATGAADAAIRLSGDRLKAFLVADRKETEPALHELLQRLPAPSRPVDIAWGDALPRTPEGKLADWCVA